MTVFHGIRWRWWNCVRSQQIRSSMPACCWCNGSVAVPIVNVVKQGEAVPIAYRRERINVRVFALNKLKSIKGRSRLVRWAMCKGVLRTLRSRQVLPLLYLKRRMRVTLLAYHQPRSWSLRTSDGVIWMAASSALALIEYMRKPSTGRAICLKYLEEELARALS